MYNTHNPSNNASHAQIAYGNSTNNPITSSDDIMNNRTSISSVNNNNNNDTYCSGKGSIITAYQQK